MTEGKGRPSTGRQSSLRGLASSRPLSASLDPGMTTIGRIDPEFVGRRLGALGVRAGPAWILLGVALLIMGHPISGWTQVATGAALFGLGLWAMGPHRARALDLASGAAVFLALASIVALTALAGPGASWFLVLPPLFALFLDGYRAVGPWAGASGVLLITRPYWQDLVAQEFTPTDVHVAVAQVLVFTATVTIAWVSWREVAHQVEQAAEAGARVRALVDNFRSGVIVTDEDGSVVLANEHFLDLFDIDAEAAEIVGKSWDTVARQMLARHTTDPVGFVRRSRRIMRKRTAVLGEDLALEDGRVLERDHVVMGLGDDLVGHLWTFRDVSDRDAVARMKDEFVSTVSHELRTPLTSVGGSLRLIQGMLGAKIDEKVDKLLGIAISNTKRLGSLVEDLLDLQSIETGALTLELSRGSVIAPIRAAIEAIGPDALGAQAEIELELLGHDAPVRLDAARIQQVVENLLSNAIKFSEPGSVVYVTVIPSADGGVRVNVKDEGPGIAQSDISKLFTRFQQVDQSATRRFGGTGLGLAICKAIIDRHNGTIGVDTEPGRGSSFWFELSAFQSSDPGVTRLTQDFVYEFDEEKGIVSRRPSDVADVPDPRDMVRKPHSKDTPIV